MNGIQRTAIVGAAALAAAAALGSGIAQAGGPAGTVYVAPGATAYSTNGHGGGDSCSHPTAHTVQGGVDAVAPGGTVIVCRGTYAEMVSIGKKLTLQGQPGSVIDATGQPYGIGIGADRVTVTGLTVKNAGVGLPEDSGTPNDGIVTASLATTPPTPGNYAVIKDVVVTGNVGAGIDLNSTRGSVVQRVKAVQNGIGVNLADDLGAPSVGNKVLDSYTSDNVTGCGVALASHTAAADGGGVSGNLIQGNTSDRNGLGGGGAGFLLATPSSGGVLNNNTFIGNEANGNGHAGFELHMHSPGNTVSGNKVIGNRFGSNNTKGDHPETIPGADPSADPDTTGVYLGSNSPLTIAVVDNTITGNVNGIFVAGAVTLAAHGNHFYRVAHPVVTVPVYEPQPTATP